MNGYEDTLNSTIAGMAQDELPETLDLSTLPDEGRGSWAPAWLPATVIEGYAAGNYTFATETTPSKKGDGFNFRLALQVKNGDDTRNTFTSFYYRPGDFSAATIAAVSALRQQVKAGNKEVWKSAPGMQRVSILLSNLKELQEATGVAIKLTPEGRIITAPFVGANGFFVRLSQNDETGYDDVTGFSKTQKKVRQSK